MSTKITLGGDPEFHLVRNGKPVSAVKVLKDHDKHNPLDLKDGIKMYSDNALVECAFPPVDSTARMMVNLRDVFMRMHEKLGEDISLLPQAAVMYPKDQLDCVEVWEAGCSPNFCAYTNTQNLPPEFTDEMRTGSCHVHIGSALLKDHDKKIEAIKLLDCVLGAASVIFDRDSTAVLRRALYGKAGEHRPTKYGVEYRVLGPWSLSNPKATELVFDLTQYCMDIMERGEGRDVIKACGEMATQKAINTNNSGLAALTLKRAGVGWRLMERINADYTGGDLATNWGIK